tara:strand:- start:1474 stop:1707 length:234 start_codon:yes stop_codon:yes gene_type:complete
MTIQDNVGKAKRLIVDLFNKHSIDSGTGGNALAELFVHMAVSEHIPRKQFLKTLGALYDSMAGQGGQNVKKRPKRPN